MGKLFIEHDGEFLASAGGVLLIAAGAIYGPSEEVTDEGRERAARLVDAILSIAVERGFARRDLLETMLSRDEVSVRVRNMAVEIDQRLGRDGLEIALRRAGGGQ